MSCVQEYFKVAGYLTSTVGGMAWHGVPCVAARSTSTVPGEAPSAAVTGIQLVSYGLEGAMPSAPSASCGARPLAVKTLESLIFGDKHPNNLVRLAY